MRSAPQLVEYYNAEIKDNPKVEMVLMAGESDEALAAWAQKAEMPWPMVSKDDHAKMRALGDARPTRGWPTYFLLNAEGEILAQGLGTSAPIKEKIKELAQPDEA